MPATTADRIFSTSSLTSPLGSVPFPSDAVAAATASKSVQQQQPQQSGGAVFAPADAPVGRKKLNER